MNNQKLLSIIIPAYNEETTIKIIIENIYKAISLKLDIKDFEIILVDDGSKDKTFDRASELKLARVFKNKRNMGKGYSMRKGATYSRAKILAFIDADGSHRIKDLARGVDIFHALTLMKPDFRSYLVLGARFQSNHHGTSNINVIGNKLYSLIAAFLWQRTIIDLTCGLRMIPKESFLKLQLYSSRYTIEVEMIGKALKANFTLIEFPIKAIPRKYGKSGIKLFREGLIIPGALILTRVNLFNFFAKRLSL